VLKYRQDLIDAVEEVSGGVRFGAVDELHLEAVFRSADDALAAGTLARWLPGILQLQSSDALTAALVDAMEDFTVYTEGRRTSISLRIPEDKAQKLAEAHRRPVVVE
jgi:hypothetical protein